MFYKIGTVKKGRTSFDNDVFITILLLLFHTKILVYRDAYSQHIRSSHNIIFEEKWANYRDKIVYKGSMDIAVALSKLPISNHIKESFVLDFNLMTVRGYLLFLSNIFSVFRSI